MHNKLREVCYCYWTISRCHSKWQSVVNNLHEHRFYRIYHKLANSPLFEWIVSIGWALVVSWCGYVTCSLLLYKGDGPGLNIRASCFWKLASNLDLGCLSITCRAGKEHKKKKKKKKGKVILRESLYNKRSDFSSNSQWNLRRRTNFIKVIVF
jgi:hypothetical protein